MSVNQEGHDGRRHVQWPPSPPDGSQPSQVQPQSEGQGDQHYGPPHRAQQPKMQLTPDELRTLKECNTESFWYRCVPIGMTLIGSVNILVNRGILKGHQRLGALPKSLGAGLLGFIMGKVSYQGACREKILRLENSPLAESMRKGRRGREVMEDMSTQRYSDTSSSDTQGYEVQPPLRQEQPYVSSYDTDRKEMRGLDDSQRPTLDREVKTSKDQQLEQSQKLNYDELRRQNRDSFSQKMAKSAGSVSSGQGGRPPYQPNYQRPSSSDTMQSYKKPQRTNEYGDVIED